MPNAECLGTGDDPTAERLQCSLRRWQFADPPPMAQPILGDSVCDFRGPALLDPLHTLGADLRGVPFRCA